MSGDRTGTVNELCRVLVIGAGPLPLGGGEGSKSAPGLSNRLMHFVMPALDAGHECLALSIEDDCAGHKEFFPGMSEPLGGRLWGLRVVRISIEDCKREKRLLELVKTFNPGLIVGAGTLQAAFTACSIAGERPVWTDLFGDPLAEMQARSEISESGSSIEQNMMVWQMMTRVLLRTDACSTVSRRQMDALYGQLLMAGREGGCSSPYLNDGPGMDTEDRWVHSIPCGLESFEFHGHGKPHGREEMLRSRGLSPNTQIVVCSGGFNAWMDVETLVDGLELAMSQNPALHCIFTGGALSGYLSIVYESFQKRVRKSDFADRFHDLGWLPHSQAMDWLQSAHLGLVVDRMCLETRLGSRNRILYHAVARCPTVASRGTEIVEDLEKSGALVCFDTGRPEQLASAVQELLHQPDRAMLLGNQLRQTCEEQYLFGATISPFLRFSADPRRHVDSGSEWESGGGDMSYRRWIEHYLDIPRRHEEWSELERFRSGRLARLRGLFRGHGFSR